MRAHVLLSPLAGILSACAPGNSLQGSMAALTPLTFTTVDVTLQGTSLVVEYADFIDGGGGGNVPFVLTVDVAGVRLDGGFSVLLDGGLDAGEPVGVASRSVLSDSRAFSAIERGYITFNDPVAEGVTTNGSFFVVFAYQEDGSLGSGYTVYGNFEGKVTQ